MRRVPLLSGSRIVHVPVDDDVVVLLPRRPRTPSTSPLPFATRFASHSTARRSPTSPGAMPASRRRRTARAPVPGAQIDPRQEAPRDRARRARGTRRAGRAPDASSSREASADARAGASSSGCCRLRRHASSAAASLVHDAAADRSRHARLSRTARCAPPSRARRDGPRRRRVTAAETIVRGGPGALLSACDAATVRAPRRRARSLQAAGESRPGSSRSPSSAPLARRPRCSASRSSSTTPVSRDASADYPHDPARSSHVSRSPLRRLYSLLPGGVRRTHPARSGGALAATAAFAGTPSVAHAEALLRAVELRACELDEPLDALVRGRPLDRPPLPARAAEPDHGASLSLGFALRLWRDAFPVGDGGTLVLVHSLTRSFAHAPDDALPASLRRPRQRTSRPSPRRRARRGAAITRALAAYRAGRTCHPLLPYADWAGCGPALSRLGRVVVAGSRDAAAARALGFVPSHSVSSALEMAHGVRADGRASACSSRRRSAAPRRSGER